MIFRAGYHEPTVSTHLTMTDVQEMLDTLENKLGYLPSPEEIAVMAFENGWQDGYTSCKDGT